MEEGGHFPLWADGREHGEARSHLLETDSRGNQRGRFRLGGIEANGVEGNDSIGLLMERNDRA